MKPEQALNGIANGLADFEAAELIFSAGDKPGLAPCMSTAAARLADDIAEALVNDGGAANPKAFETIASGRPAFIRMLASFGAMARELRRLQDSEEQLKRRNGELGRLLDAANQANAELESSLTAHAQAGNGQRQRLALYREAAAQFTFGEMRDGAPHYRQLFEAYSADIEAEAAAERGDA